ncbi:MAG TPA: molybdopterin cofactor-binding domain-containing protein, partial [Candidatus Acidoferrales bacterium]|nr:molybdopterin cofactor-binding domain-containing protein [Candidatus Acidoferrales bacterium]
MSASSRLDRRAFLKTTAAGGAALVVGFHFPLAAFPQQPQQRPPVNPFNAWVRITPSGDVTLTMAKSEMGQGVMTALPMILAEELDVEWSRVRIEQARTDPQTYSHGTGGSGSVADSYLPLRKAGAAARAMLVAAAAQNWNVDVSACRTEKGKVIHGPRNTVLTYGELVDAASKLPIPDLNKVTLKNPADFTIIGKSTPRRDTPLKTNGTAIFGLDVRVPGMLYAVIARCPTFGGRAKSFNADKARAVPGVKEVVQIDPIAAGANSAGGVAVV